MLECVGGSVEVCSTSAEGPFIPAVVAVGDSVADLAHGDTLIHVQAAIFIGRALGHSVMWTWKTIHKRCTPLNFAPKSLENQHPSYAHMVKATNVTR